MQPRRGCQNRKEGRARDYPEAPIRTSSMAHIDYNEDNPGPGTYCLNYKHVLPRAPIQSIARPLPIWCDNDKPGPGTYNVRKEGNDSPRFTAAGKTTWFPGNGVLGPGAYFLDDHVKHTNIRAPAFTIPGKTTWAPWSGVPGPGTYNLREEVPASDDQGYSLGRRFTTKGSPSPGPAHYRPPHASTSPRHPMGQPVRPASRPSPPGVGASNLRSLEFAGPRWTMGRRFYRLRDMQRQRRYSRALKPRPHPRPGSPARAAPAIPRSSQSANAAPSSPQLEFHRKNSTHVHVQPAIPRRASSGVLPRRTSTITTQVDLPAPGAPPPEPVVPKSNTWMDVGKKLQRTRDAITAAANVPDPEPPLPAPAAEGESPPPG